jgi:membrane protease YdiL (CAAX protease family)
VAASAFLVGVFLAGLLGAIGMYATGGDEHGAGLLVGSFVGLWIPLVGSALLASRLFGSRSTRRDLGLAVRLPTDLVLGIVVGLAGLLAATAVQLALSPFPDLTGTNTNFIEEQSGSVVGTVVVVVSTLIGAPIVEELFFRGLLQRSMARIGLAAAFVQAIVFGLIHVTPSEGLGNVGIVLGVGVFGLVLGLAARHFGRLGPTMIGHAVFNADAVIPLLLK